MSEIFTPDVLFALMVTTLAGLATGLGGLLVFTTKAPNARMLAFGLAFAAGAMVYVSLTDILGKAVDAFSLDSGARGSSYGTFAFLGGVLLIVLIDRLIPNPHQRLETDDPFFRQHNREYIKRVGLLTAAALTAHNFPQGLATLFATQTG